MIHNCTDFSLATGDYFQGRFPVMVRRQKVYKEGASPNLSVDRIGGDHAASRFSPRCSCSGTDGRGGATDGDMEQPVLTPHDMRVGQTVWLMKRPMTVCGWDETAHIWWENTTGEEEDDRVTCQSNGGGGRVI